MMTLHTVRQGLDLPIHGEPEQVIDRSKQVSRVAVMASDFVGLKPTMHVRPGDIVRRGQPLFEDKKNPGVRYTAIGDGKVVAVHRGERRALQSVVLELGSADRAGKSDQVAFSSHSGKHPASMSGDEVRALLVESGEWVALRSRPFSRVPAIDATPRSIFVTVTDSHPLAPDPSVVMEGRSGDFERGLAALGKLTPGPVYVCTPPGLQIDTPKGDFRVEEFKGPHPSGTAGLHIHQLDPAGRGREVWWIGYQEVLAVGRLFETGRLDVARVVSLAGPAVERPRLLRTRVGAATSDLVEGELAPGENRVISGSVLFGRTAMGEVHGFVCRRHQQVSVLREGREREFLGWLAPGLDRFSTASVFLSKLLPRRRFAFDTSTNGSDRAIVPIGLYEKVFPIDIPAPFLMRALAAGDIEQAETLGALELDEEDLALCSFVCPGKLDYGLLLRDLLDTIEKEG